MVTLCHVLYTVTAILSYCATVQAVNQAFRLAVEPYITSDCWSEDRMEDVTWVYETYCHSFAQPFGGFRHVYVTSNPAFHDDVEDFGNCIIQVWADADCKGDYVGQVQGASGIGNQSKCARVEGSGTKGRNLKVLCKDVEGDWYLTGFSPPETHYLSLGKVHEDAGKVATVEVSDMTPQKASQTVSPSEEKKRPAVDIPDRV